MTELRLDCEVCEGPEGIGSIVLRLDFDDDGPGGRCEHCGTAYYFSLKERYRELKLP